jgi:uncharacterized protein YwgA
MDMYALTKLIDSVGKVDSRKRLHKCVFLLQLAGLDMEAEYCLYYYGPFSRDVAEATDLLTQSKVLAETEIPNPMGASYSYEVTEKGKGMLTDYEARPEGKAACERVSAFIDQFQALLAEPLWTLELASTVAFYRFVRNVTAAQARAMTAEFKNVRPNASVLDDAEKIAERFAPFAHLDEKLFV